MWEDGVCRSKGGCPGPKVSVGRSVGKEITVDLESLQPTEINDTIDEIDDGEDNSNTNVENEKVTEEVEIETNTEISNDENQEGGEDLKKIVVHTFF